MASSLTADSIEVGREGANGLAAKPGPQGMLAKVRAVRQLIPGWLCVYLCAVYIVLGLLVWWMPADDYDSMVYYLARIRLERIGPLRETATLEVEYLFPKFFDYLHTPLLDWGWFTTLPNFALFSATVVAIVWWLPSRMAVRIVLGLAACSPVLLNITSAKNDVTVALLAFLGWLWIFYANPKAAWYPAGGLLLAAMIVGTKWHGLLLAPLLLVLLGIEVVKARNFRPATWALVLGSLPLAWFVSSADVYLQNRLIDGAFCPVPQCMHQEIDVRRNIVAFASNSLLETLEVPFYVADTRLHGKLWQWLMRVTLGSKCWTYAIMPTTHICVYGVTILIVIASAGIAACAPRTPWPVRAAALLSIVYCAAMLSRFYYCDLVNRYFLTTYIVGLVPCSYLAQFVPRTRALRWAFYAYLVFVSLQSVLLNQEKRLLPFTRYVAFEDRFERLAPLYHNLFDREALQFHLWEGHLFPYRVLRQFVREEERLLIVNCHTNGVDGPFLYPFLEGRTGKNTRIVNLRFGQTVPRDAAQQFDYMLVFKGRRGDADFVPLYEDPEVSIYQSIRLTALGGGVASGG
ncbi:MAG TPA: hypothetical protein VHC22_03965 [Pirellulales bacterium]|nr:hypothetical protein [Pirellulales bacterium]